MSRYSVIENEAGFASLLNGQGQRIASFGCLDTAEMFAARMNLADQMADALERVVDEVGPEQTGPMLYGYALGTLDAYKDGRGVSEEEVKAALVEGYGGGDRHKEQLGSSG